jgi:hypothetical protein
VIRILHLAVLTMLIKSSVAQQHLTELTLDVLTIPPVEEKIVRGVGCGCGAASGTTHQPPVKVTLLEISPQAFDFGDRIVFELRVENVGRVLLPLAISRDSELAPDCRRDDGRVTTNFALFAKGSDEIITTGPGLYGSRAVAGTTMVLNPGERLRVRVPATVARLDATHPLSEDPQLLELYGSFLDQESPCHSFFERSQNALPIQLWRPKQPN